MNGPNGGEGAIGLVCMLGIFALVVALVVAIWWRIFDKAGYGGPMGLLMLLPLVNFIMLLVLAFSEWPVQQEMRRLRRELGELEEYGGGRRVNGGGAPGLPRRDPEGEGEERFRR